VGVRNVGDHIPGCLSAATLLSYHGTQAREAVEFVSSKGKFQPQLGAGYQGNRCRVGLGGFGVADCRVDNAACAIDLDWNCWNLAVEVC